MNDKYSLAEKGSRSLEEKPRPLDEGITTVGVYPHEDEGQKKKETSIGGIIGSFFGLFLIAIIGVFVWAYNSEPSSIKPIQNPVVVSQNSAIPTTLPQIIETTNGKSGREMVVTREFTGTVVAYKGFNTPVVVFDIGGTQQQYQFRMGNDGKVAIGGVYKVKVQYWHNYWDFLMVEQIK